MCDITNMKQVPENRFKLSDALFIIVLSCKLLLQGYCNISNINSFPQFKIIMTYIFLHGGSQLDF